jgi:hypothetical protein
MAVAIASFVLGSPTFPLAFRNVDQLIVQQI